jgi:hypothetical protein
VNLPPEAAARLAVALASQTGGYSGASRMSVSSPIRDVAPAATARTVSES